MNDRTVKVLYCILDDRFGGPHRLALSAARWLRRHDIETLFLLGHKSDQAWQPDGFSVFALKYIQFFQRRQTLVNMVLFWLFLPRNLWRLRHIIRSNGVTVVHIDGVTNFVPALAAVLTKTPIVWLYNDHLPTVFARLLLPVVTRLAAVVLVQGEKLKEQRTAHSARLNAKTKVLYSSVDPAEFEPDRYTATDRERLRKELGVPPDCAVIGIIGNLNRLKGHAYFIQAAAKIKEKVPRARFLVVGRKLDTDPGYWEQLQRLTTENGLENDVIYAGFQADIPGVMAALDVLVLASVLESCPVVVLEAMAMRVPVVATDVGAVSELLAHGAAGTVAPVRDADAIAQAAVDNLTGPPERVRTMTETARRRVEEVFALDRIAGRQKEIYQAALKR